MLPRSRPTHVADRTNRSGSRSCRRPPPGRAQTSPHGLGRVPSGGSPTERRPVNVETARVIDAPSADDAASACDPRSRRPDLPARWRSPPHPDAAPRHGGLARHGRGPPARHGAGRRQRGCHGPVPIHLDATRRPARARRGTRARRRSPRRCRDVGPPERALRDGCGRGRRGAGDRRADRGDLAGRGERRHERRNRSVAGRRGGRGPLASPTAPPSRGSPSTARRSTCPCRPSAQADISPCSAVRPRLR